MIRFGRIGFSLVFIVRTVLPSAEGQEKEIVKLEKEIELPGVEGRIDHFSEDVAGQRVFVAALESGSIEILDFREGKRIAQIKNLKEPQGVYYDSASGGLFVATGGDGKLRAYNGTSFELQKTADLGNDADNIRYDEHSSKIWVGYGDGGIAIIDSRMQKIADIPLGTHPEAFQIERSGDRAYVNVPKQFGVVVIDPKSRAVIAKWGLGGPLANYPMALDEAGKRLFVACRLPGRLVILNTDSGQVVQKLPIIGDADDVFYDKVRHRIYVIGGEGAIEIIESHGPDQFVRVNRVNTGAGARTGIFVPQWSRLLVARPHRGAQSAAVLVYAL
jgi:hypothetical protein